MKCSVSKQTLLKVAPHICMISCLSFLTPGVVGITLNVGWAEPEDPYNPEHLEASERDILFNFGWFADPVVYGNYPKVMIDRIKQKSTIQNLTVSRLPVFSKEEQKNMKGL